MFPGPVTDELGLVVVSNGLDKYSHIGGLKLTSLAQLCVRNHNIMAVVIVDLFALGRILHKRSAKAE